MARTPTKDIVKKYDLSPDELDEAVEEALSEADVDAGELETQLEESIQDFEPDSIIGGRILNIVGDDVIVDVGYKSEGIIPISQFDDPQSIDVGDEVDVLLETVEDESGMVVLSKKKADKIRGWERVISTYDKGDPCTGVVAKKIKGGLLVDIGVLVFLPASQISIRRVPDTGEYLGKTIKCKIIKIDESRMNIVVSRRRLIEDRREKQKEELLKELREGDVVKGVVKNIAEFGAFVDLGGLDGLLHITDMSWGRVTHPSEMLSIDDEIEVKVIKIDLEKERISLGLKQKVESPWLDAELKYPKDTVVRGRVVNVLSYGAFVKLETGIEGLVHISEMSWTKRINHPSEIVEIGEMVDVMVLDINTQKEEISLGIKQTLPNPWDEVEEKYPPGTVITGTVRNLANYGAFVEIEEGVDGLLHVSDLSWTKKVLHPSEVLTKGDEVECMVLTVDPNKKRVALGVKQLHEDPWDRIIPEKYQKGTIVTGEVTKVTNFGVFVELEEDLEGLLHISEMADRQIDDPAEIVEVGEKVDVKVIKVDPVERKIGLSLKRVGLDEEAEPIEVPDLDEVAEAAVEGAAADHAEAEAERLAEAAERARAEAERAAAEAARAREEARKAEEEVTEEEVEEKAEELQEAAAEAEERAEALEEAAEEAEEEADEEDDGAEAAAEAEEEEAEETEETEETEEEAAEEAADEEE